ncbi:Trypanosomal VSG domain/Trypanosome variant surface glycoprotein C-terminal domain containing protein, putative [Trypanosoma equiperdum]|uniref:Trypanosomal VSG domain/Trypanosome variant surface glycoprotein C-terminal domain containing protein, putative n=1 Tax=Trypanosoma equiperdum TaxID=5694 RepID=A0A1G4I9U1_TRYEQ|nr:Trypanosomal VSG domain/Trypanosome variant surface glycoprotein C-terminal domain containing protein, putative [Trypanosoma equiperdum]
MIKIAFHFIILVAVVRTVHSFANGDNTGVFGPLCKTLQLADGAITFDPTITTASQKASDIYKLNMTMAPAAWRQLLTEKTEDTKPKAKDNPPQSAPDDWKSKWTTWADAALYLETDKNEATFKEQFSTDKASAQQLANLRPTIAQLADAAYDLEAFYKTGQQNKPKDDAALITQLYQAIYGKKPSNMDQPETAPMFSGAAAAYAASCATGETPPAAKTLAGTFLCVCGSANAASHKPCADAQTTQAAWELAAPPQASAWPNLRQICPATEGTVITDGLITNLINAVMAHTRVGTNDLYIGGLKSEANCDGGGTACCVKITNGAQNKQLKKNAIQWVKDLDTIASELRKRPSYNSQVTEYNAAITLLEQQVKAVIKRAHYTSVDQQTASTGAVNSKESKTQLQKVNCNNHKKKSTCPTTGCHWNSTTEDKGEHCKPKDGEEQTTKAGAGEQATGAGTTDKCSAAQNAEDCAKITGPIPQGKKAFCGWITLNNSCHLIYFNT